MDNNVKLLLLKILKFNGDISPLIKLGYQYSQIIDSIKNEIAEGNAERKNGMLIITEKGNSVIEDISKKLNRKDSNKWIEPEVESRIPKIPINFIFLPNQNELTFMFFE
jgi:hypothetical protein